MAEWGFKIPNLPEEWYTTLQDIRLEHRMTQWQVVILALSALSELRKRDPEAYGRAVEFIRGKYPQEFKEPRKVHK